MYVEDIISFDYMRENTIKKKRRTKTSKTLKLKGGSGKVGNIKKGKTIKRNICSPYSNLKKISQNTCMTTEMVEKVKDMYNVQHPTLQIQTDDPVNALEMIKKQNNCKNDNCIVSKIKSKQLQDEITKEAFIPEKPVEWVKNPTEWLSNFDILDVLKQYEKAYPTFKFIGPVPIDFNTKINNSCVSNELCSLHLGTLTTVHDIGIIFNLDKHDEPGSHWVSMFIDKSIKKIFYFDSASTEIPREVDELQRRLIGENADFLFLSNSVEHQRGNTECGMYSIYFIISMLLSKNRTHRFVKHFNNKVYPITDKMVEQYRSVYFQ